MASAQRWPDRKALSFFWTADTYQRASTWTYAEFLAGSPRRERASRPRRQRGSSGRYVLPNLPETHFTIWGGEAAGVVLAVNPLLAPDLIVEILRAAKVRVLVTLAPFPGAELWEQACAASFSALRTACGRVGRRYDFSWRRRGDGGRGRSGERA